MEESRPKATPENALRLYDLVRVKDERVKPAFYYALRDTLVADNMEDATRIGLRSSKRWRVVTLTGIVNVIIFFVLLLTNFWFYVMFSGGLIETSGTMAGGGNSCKRGLMGRNVTTDTSGKETSAKEIAAMEQRLQQLDEECGQLRATKQNLEDSLLELTRSSREGNTNLQKWKMEVKVGLFIII